jgi:hypothetical protein
MCAADARQTLCVRPLGISGGARAALARGAPQLRAAYRHGASLAIDGCAEDIFLSTPGQGLLPLHVVVREADLARIVDAAQCAGPIPLPLRLDLRKAHVFQSQLVPDPAGLRSDRALDNLAALARWLRADPSPLGFGMPAGAWLTRDGPAAQWVAALREVSPASKKALQALIGRGTGSTPAGDDFLIGMLAQAWASAGERAPLLALLRALSDRLPRLTTTASVGYLRAALRGEFGSHLTVLVRGLARVARPRVLALAAKVAGHGASSGLDTLAGFVAASEACDPGRRALPSLRSLSPG